MMFEKERTDKREERKWRIISLTFTIETEESLEKILKIVPACHCRKWFMQIN